MKKTSALGIGMQHFLAAFKQHFLAAFKMRRRRIVAFGESEEESKDGGNNKELHCWYRCRCDQVKLKNVK